MYPAEQAQKRKKKWEFGLYVFQGKISHGGLGGWSKWRKGVWVGSERDVCRHENCRKKYIYVHNARELMVTVHADSCWLVTHCTTYYMRVCVCFYVRLRFEGGRLKKELKISGYP